MWTASQVIIYHMQREKIKPLYAQWQLCVFGLNKWHLLKTSLHPCIVRSARISGVGARYAWAADSALSAGCLQCCVPKFRWCVHASLTARKGPVVTSQDSTSVSTAMQAPSHRLMSLC